MLKKFFLPVILLTLVACQSGPLDTRLTAENKNRVAAQAFEKMTDEEKKLLMGYIFRTMMSSMGNSLGDLFNHKSGAAKLAQPDYQLLPEGKTIRELLKDQEQWQAQQK